MSGLASALWLSEAGHRVTLLERRGSLGGRTTAIPLDIVDDVPDNGQHVFASGYVHLMRYLDSVGTRESVCFPGHMTVRMPGGGTRRSAFGRVAGLRADKPDISSAKVPADLLVTGIREARRTKTPISIGYPTVDLDTLFIDGAKKAFANNGVEVRHRAVVAGVEVVDGTVAGVILNDGERIPAGAVICAVPVWNVKGLLDQVPGHERIYEAIEHLTPVPIVSVNLYLDRSIGMTDWGEILYGGEGVLEQVWDRQQMHSRNASRNHFYSTTVSAAYELTQKSNAEITETQMDMLRRYYPDAAGAEVIHSHVVRMPKSTFAQRPGSSGIRPDQRTAVAGLALAGDWTRTDWTTTMEGACQSAARAVDVILDYANQPR